MYSLMSHREPFKDLIEDSTDYESLIHLAMTHILVNGTDYYYKRDDTNATLVNKFKDHTLASILDGGTSITIIT